jgi:hypothetical protein
LATVGFMLIRPSAADRDRAIDVLKASFVEGRITEQELDLRVGQALGTRYFADLVALIGDLPASPFSRLPAHRATPVFRRTGRQRRTTSG